MGKTEWIGGTFWFLFSVFIGYQSFRLGLGTLRMPGPGFLFFWTAVFIGTLSLIDIWRSLKQEGVQAAKATTAGSSNIIKVALVLLSLLIYVALVEWLGFVLTTLLLFLFLLGVIEKKKWSFAILVSVIVTACSYLVFETALSSQLPKGLLESLRF
jgi:putative tricarboxylic transport membrane protein